MVDNCASCFFFRAAPPDVGQVVGNSHCRRTAPEAPDGSRPDFPWRRVEADWWCGEGADAISGASFSSGVVGTSGSGVSSKGSFTLDAAPSTTIVNPSIGIGGAILLTASDSTAAALLRAHGLYVSNFVPNTSFTVSTGDGSAAAGTEIFNFLTC